MLVGKKLCIVGGTGFIGTAVAKKAQQLGASVTCVSRKGIPLNLQDWQKQIKYVQADAINPTQYSEYLENADAVVNTVGTLIDTSITKGKQPGEHGTYEYLNRDVAIKVADQLESFKKYKKLVYMSSAAPPPFIKRYQITKEEAEQHMLGLQHVKSTFLRPGFIYSFQERWWSLGLKYEIDAYNWLHTRFIKTVPQNSLMKQTVSQLFVERTVLLNDVVNAILYSSFHKETDGQILFNEDIERYSQLFEKQ